MVSSSAWVKLENEPASTETALGPHTGEPLRAAVVTIVCTAWWSLKDSPKLRGPTMWGSGWRDGGDQDEPRRRLGMSPG
ncbi:MAG TPA: hypothetical protein VN240_10690 [Propylenella sp.]|nr:hypothetical protein [Propylenella sp.]